MRAIVVSISAPHYAAASWELLAAIDSLDLNATPPDGVQFQSLGFDISRPYSDAYRIMIKDWKNVLPWIPDVPTGALVPSVTLAEFRAMRARYETSVAAFPENAGPPEPI